MWKTFGQLLLAGLVWIGAEAGPAAGEQAQTAAPNNPNCRNTGSFDAWLDRFRQEARGNGISNATIAAALGGMTLDPGIIQRDRRQGFFAQTFTAFSGKLITSNRIQNGLSRLRQHRDLLARVEQQWGVPGPVIVAFWGLESDFGSMMGNLPVLRSLATLAYDCRRPELFRGELMEALRIIDRGDLRPEEMIGSWAGELGQTQFLPAHYMQHAVDYDGDGRRDLLQSVPDVLASTANFLAFLGWQRGQPWLEEVRLTRELPWQEADLAIQHPVEKWAAWGVKRVGGQPFAADVPAASLLLPMGRHGPAFLAYPNFQVYLKWNQSLNYSITAAHLADRLAGAPAMDKGNGTVPEMSLQQVKELQMLMAKRGYFSGEVDGKIGAATRAGVKAAQLKLGLPADSYPTPELLERMQAMR
ncbi:MAG TPA: lytic murein transglycosylase [Hyphomicrobiaceae bacterium]|jgi:lytic murein transglycosylase|nr:lytic murein transglycosylase [Hyphomicrobiaceae bacterium]